jgi:L-lactate dehydrogenase complex protein LldE
MSVSLNRAGATATGAAGYASLIRLTVCDLGTQADDIETITRITWVLFTPGLPTLMAAPASRPAPGRVGLFVTCLVDMIRPSIGFAAVKLLEDAGCAVDVPRQSCCGQPAFNSGDRATAQAIARRVIIAFAPFDYVVAPSGSCAGMIKAHYPELFHGDPNWQPHADALAAKTYELTSFLVDVCGIDRVAARLDATATYHDSCSGLRELRVHDQPRRLLASVRGLQLTEMRDADVCCGFGGTFCVKYPDISNAIVAKKAAAVTATGASLLLAGDLGCLMNMAGKLQRDGAAVEVRHVAEVLAGMTDEPAIGAPRQAPLERRRPAAEGPASSSAHRVSSGADGGETPPLQEAR